MDVGETVKFDPTAICLLLTRTLPFESPPEGRDIRRGNELIQLAMAVSGEQVHSRAEVMVVANIALVAVVGRERVATGSCSRGPADSARADPRGLRAQIG